MRWDGSIISSVSLREATYLLLGAAFYSLAMPGKITFFSPASCVALIPLFFCMRKGAHLWKAAICGLIFGTISSFFLLNWISFTVSVYGKLGLFLGILSALLLSAYCGIFVSIFSLLTAEAVKRFGKPGIFSAPFFWSGAEIVRVKLKIGFPWLLFGYSQYGDYYARQFAAFGGVIGTGFFLVLVNVLFYLSLEYFIDGLRKRSAALFLAALSTLLFIHLPGFLSRGESFAAADNDSLLVSAIQPNIDLLKKWDEEFQGETIGILESLTEDQVREGVDLIIWPETALPFFFYWDAEPTVKIRSFVKGIGKPVITGVPWYEARDGGKYFNSIVLISPAGKIAKRYDKIMLVPFGEYVPFRKVLFFVDKITHGSEDFSRGERVKLLSWGAVNVVPTVCYEAIFPQLSVEGVNLGGNLLVNLTNDAWFGDTLAPYQQLYMAAYRSVETGRYMVRVSNSGISAVIDQHGRVEKSIGLFTRGRVMARVRPLSGMTFYVKNAKFINLVIISGSIILIGGTIIGRFRNGRNI
ncbi:MAG: apolipoprotein N-acyltransferase [Deltaproteobacteria bacterium]|nr:apolipoprotein N-acyltransferase [Deltaproteobacteria bacterium]NIS78178.1 apolipoprotein N-acyltransferase [Deltaproteobacteria bacterium]